MPRNAVPPLNRGNFWNQRQATDKFHPMEPCVVVVIKSIEKAYPVSILTHHLVINDQVGKTPVAITYCPLSNSIAVYDRRVTYKEKETLLYFGNSGMLRNCNHVLWDQETETWWQQGSGKALTGELHEQTLTRVPFMLLPYEAFFKHYPYGLIMANDGPDKELYGTNLYYRYDDLEKFKPLLFTGLITERLPAMQRVTVVEAMGTPVIYPHDVVASMGVINDTPNDIYVALFYKPGMHSALDKKYIHQSKDVGTVIAYSSFVQHTRITFKKEGDLFVDKETGSVWDITGKCISGSLKGEQLKLLPVASQFAFLALANHPKALIFGEVD